MVEFLTLTTFSYAAVIRQGPTSLTRDPEEFAYFTCTVECSHSIDWYVEGFIGDITSICADGQDGMVACKEVLQSCSSATSTQLYTERLRILARQDLASSNLAVQCAAVSRSTIIVNSCPPFLLYSRFALLTSEYSVVSVSKALYLSFLQLDLSVLQSLQLLM